MHWIIRGTGLEEAPEPIAEILEFRCSKFYKAQDWGPLALCTLEGMGPDDEPLWIFIDEIRLDPEDLDPERGRWAAADMGENPSCVMG